MQQKSTLSLCTLFDNYWFVIDIRAHKYVPPFSGTPVTKYTQFIQCIIFPSTSGYGVSITTVFCCCIFNGHFLTRWQCNSYFSISLSLIFRYVIVNDHTQLQRYGPKICYVGKGCNTGVTESCHEDLDSHKQYKDITSPLDKRLHLLDFSQC